MTQDGQRTTQSTLSGTQRVPAELRHPEGTRRGRLMAIFAHPDDESLLAGGTLAACSVAGLEVTLLCMTRGELGPIAQQDVATRETLASVRETELQNAAGVLGIHAVECLDYPDGELQWVDQTAIETDLIRRIRRWRPEVVITFGPDGLYWHYDHIAVHRLAMAALEAVTHEGLSPWVYHATWPQGRMAELVATMTSYGLPGELWGLHPGDFGVPAESITTILDIRPFLAAKLRALRSHRSQLDQDHLFHVIPEDVAEAFLGYEYFVRAQPALGAAARPPGCPTGEDWLEHLLKQGRAQSSWRTACGS